MADLLGDRQALGTDPRRPVQTGRHRDKCAMHDWILAVHTLMNAFSLWIYAHDDDGAFTLQTMGGAMGSVGYNRTTDLWLRHGHLNRSSPVATCQLVHMATWQATEGSRWRPTTSAPNQRSQCPKAGLHPQREPLLPSSPDRLPARWNRSASRGVRRRPPPIVVEPGATLTYRQEARISGNSP